MKRRALIAVLAAALLLGACAGKEPICGKTYSHYGLFSQEKRNPHIRYEVDLGAVIIAVLGVETVILPIIIVGWFLYAPAGTQGKEIGVTGGHNQCPVPPTAQDSQPDIFQQFPKN